MKALKNILKKRKSVLNRVLKKSSTFEYCPNFPLTTDKNQENEAII